jgi:hypothetical protein
MELLTKDGRVRAICRECGKLHSRAKCPRRRSKKSEAARVADVKWEWVQAYWAATQEQYEAYLAGRKEPKRAG